MQTQKQKQKQLMNIYRNSKEKLNESITKLHKNITKPQTDTHNTHKQTLYTTIKPSRKHKTKTNNQTIQNAIKHN